MGKRKGGAFKNPPKLKAPPKLKSAKLPNPHKLPKKGKGCFLKNI